MFTPNLSGNQDFGVHGANLGWSKKYKMVSCYLGQQTLLYTLLVHYSDTFYPTASRIA
jgi:hypothetical protein